MRALIGALLIPITPLGCGAESDPDFGSTEGAQTSAGGARDGGATDLTTSVGSLTLPNADKRVRSCTGAIISNREVVGGAFSERAVLTAASCFSFLAHKPPDHRQPSTMTSGYDWTGYFELSAGGYHHEGLQKIKEVALIGVPDPNDEKSYAGGLALVRLRRENVAGSSVAVGWAMPAKQDALTMVKFASCESSKALESVDMRSGDEIPASAICRDHDGDTGALLFDTGSEKLVGVIGHAKTRRVVFVAKLASAVQKQLAEWELP